MAELDHPQVGSTSGAIVGYNETVVDVYAPLNPQQVEVLKWIADGCPDGVMSGYAFKTTAAALQNRRLVQVSKRHGTWSATVTDAGRYYVEHGRHREPTTTARSSALRRKPANPVRQKPVAATAPQARAPGVVDLFIKEIQDAGGVLSIDRITYARSQGSDYEKLIQAAKRSSKVPAGKRIVVKHLAYPKAEIHLEPAIPGTEIEARPVPVPERTPRDHPVVAQFRDRQERHELSKIHLPRASLILHALVVEAECRGHTATLSPEPTDTWTRRNWTGSRDGHISITVGGHGHALRILEIGMPSRSGWRRSRPYGSRDSYFSNTGTGRLSIEFCGYGGGREGRNYRWSDNTRARLEDKLPDILREVEIRAAEDEHRHQEHLAAEALRQRQREEAARLAAIEKREKHRADTLLEQTTRWETANRIRAYLTALRAAIDTHNSTQGDTDHLTSDARQWLAWAEMYVDRLDPLNGLPGMPAPPP